MMQRKIYINTVFYKGGLGWVYTSTRCFCGSTEFTEVSDAGIEFVPNHTRVFGRVLRAVPNLTEDFVPNHTRVFGRALRAGTLPKISYRTIPECSVEY